MSTRSTTACAIATAFLAGELEPQQMIDRGSRLWGKRWRWMHLLAERVASAFGGRTRPRVATLTSYVLADRGFSRAAARYDLRVERPYVGAATFCPVQTAEAWPLLQICSVRQLAKWLNLSISELDWFAHRKSQERMPGRGALGHYRYRAITKRFGRIRLIEAPKPRLKAIQRQINEAILEHIPPHGAAHGFRRGRSIRTFAEPHTDQEVVLKIDLEDFFPNISLARVQALFRAVGYPETVADTLAGLCSNTTPSDAWDGAGLDSAVDAMRLVRWLYAKPHLPQGAPTSPALANLCAYRLDCRLSALAQSAGAVYTRYADDLGFSGGSSFARVVERFQLHVCATAMEEGFRVHHRKTRIMRRGVCQRLAGLVVNKRLNLPRKDVDRLTAILTNCIRHGAPSQNQEGHDDFRSHLQGRVAYVESINPQRGLRLRRQFDQIRW